MKDFDAHMLYIDEKAFDNAAETLFGGWDSIEEVIDEALDVHEESSSDGSLYLGMIDSDGKPELLKAISEIRDAEAVGVEIESPSETMMRLQKEFIGSLSLQIDEESPFLKEIQNQAKKYKRDKAAYKFWKDQEFVGNNRAGKRLKAHGRRK